MRVPVATTVLAALVLIIGSDAEQGSDPGFVRQHRWVGQGQWIRADTHMHTRASDGGQTVAALAQRAHEHGCQAIAITDHADRNLRAATPQYMADIAAARLALPDMPVIAGLEWNVPPYGGEEHASVFVPQTSQEGEVLTELKRQWDDYDRLTKDSTSAEAALAWLASATAAEAVRPVVVYNHPSRKDPSSLANIEDILRWRATNDLVVGFEGAPGHQGATSIGSYLKQEQPIDRWDPVVGRPGDAWDALLQRGVDVHGAMASSDFHTNNPRSLNDFWPCQFSETWYYVPERTVAGVLEAMRAGTYFGVHGHIARNVELTLRAGGLPRTAVTGEIVRVASGSAVTAALSFDVPLADWQGQPNRIDAIEFIVARPGGVTLEARAVVGAGRQVVTQALSVGAEGLVVRARLRRVVPDGPDLMAYTNAIRVLTR